MKLDFMDPVDPEDPWHIFNGKVIKEIRVGRSSPNSFDIEFEDGWLLQLDAEGRIRYHIREGDLNASN